MRKSFSAAFVVLAIGLGAALAVPTSALGSTASRASALAAKPRTVLATARVKLNTVVSGLDSPVAIAFRGTDPNHMYVAEQSGSLVVVTGGHVTGTVLTETVSHDNEEGLLGVAFSKDGTKVYVDYTDPTGDIHVVQYTMKGLKAVLSSRRQLLLIAHHTYTNHNGGDLVLGPDNMLYIGVGDGGSGGDPNGNGQNKDVLLAKILRIDPSHASGSLPYTIPAGNPFKGKPGKRGEIWMYGLRNPWRFSFDKKNGDMWIGDVGQDKYEEVDYARAGTGAGANWGWNLREGFHPYNGGAMPPGARNPILERPHTAGDCAIIGGYVYRGSPSIPLVGAYVFGDECTGVIRAVTQSGGRVTQSAGLKLNVSQLTTFGEGPGGALFAASRTGTIYVFARG
jgi:glucose/arabinose dehydrogenase